MKPTQRYAHLELAHLRDTHDEVGRVPVNFAVIKATSESDLLQAKAQWQEALKRRKKAVANVESARYTHADIKAVK